jgi:hypothetical protein
MGGRDFKKMISRFVDALATIFSNLRRLSGSRSGGPGGMEGVCISRRIPGRKVITDRSTKFLLVHHHHYSNKGSQPGHYVAFSTISQFLIAVLRS